MRVLILGGTGFVGPPLVRRLVDEGHEVTVFHSGRTEANLPETVRHVHGDFVAFEKHVAALRRLEPQVVVDTVPYRDKAGHGILQFADVADRGVVLTSGDVYRAFARLLGSEPGAPDAVPLTEDSPLRSGSSPDRTEEIDHDNLEVEHALEGRADLAVTVLRLPVVFGPRDPYNRLYSYLRRMADDRPAILLDERVSRWRWSRHFVDNVAAAVALAVCDERSAGRIYNIAPLETPTEIDWARSIGRVLGWEGEVTAAPPDLLPESQRVEIDARQDIVMDSTRIRKELGYTEPVSFDEAIRRTAEWALSTPPQGLELDYAAEDRALATLRNLDAYP
jgi:nucleoside-diphosphate-sugar epimerase